VKPVYIAVAVIGVVAWVVLGLIIARGPQPEIVVPAEVLTKVGPLNITNTLLTAWIVMILLVALTFLATRSMKLMPASFQNFVEAVAGFVLDQVEEIAGEKNGRRFFMVVATFFLFILVSNWFALLPFFNAIGKTEDVGHEIFVEIAEHDEHGEAFADDEKFGAWKMDESAGMTLVKPNGKDAEFEITAGEQAPAVLDRYIVFLAAEFADFHTEEEEAPSAETVRAAAEALRANPEAPQLLTEAGGEGHPVTSPALGQAISGIDFPGEKFALVIPFFRSVYSDVNNTLALGLISFVIVEFWGLQTLGAGYLKKFFNFSSPIAAFVGVLELLSEFIRIISFTFRLFGNIFAGEVLIVMLTFLMPFLLVDIIYGLELFVGFIQAAVFALLTLVFGVMAVEHHGEEEHHEAVGEGPHPAGAVQAH
jgi:F-type H+-transporting ATPase subunit a